MRHPVAALALVAISALESAALGPGPTVMLPGGAWFQAFTPDPGVTNTRAAVIICPGGGYNDVVDTAEGYRPAAQFNRRGMTAFVLRYHNLNHPPLGPSPLHPLPLQDLQQAIRTVRSRAAAYNIDPVLVGVMGCSAGGHMAATGSVYWAPGNPASADPLLRESAKPAFTILLYPVISMEQGIAEPETRLNIIGRYPSRAMIDSLSLQLHVTASTPQTFITYGDADKEVPVINSLLYYDSLVSHHVPVKMTVERGRGHGFLPDMFQGTTWFDSCMVWLGRQGIVQTQTGTRSMRAASGQGAPRPASRGLAVSVAPAVLRDAAYDLTGRKRQRGVSPAL